MRPRTATLRKETGNPSASPSGVLLQRGRSQRWPQVGRPRAGEAELSERGAGVQPALSKMQKYF